MSVELQLLSVFISFIYGMFIKIFIILNNKISNNIIFKLLYTFIIVVGYIVIIYKINKGIFHIYLLFIMGLGYLMCDKLCVKYTCKVKK